MSDSELRDRTIVVAITGGIAAYKMAEVVSALRQAGAHVHVIMTEAAMQFVTPLTFSTLSGNEVLTDMFARPARWDVRHISLAERADVMLIAPATANTMAKIATGITDNMVTAIALATRAPVLIAPAMNARMLEHRATQHNLEHLRSFGYHVMECGEGFLACGSAGKGRLPEPETIVAELARVLGASRDLKGLEVLITSGPTREPIDAVRFISNPSTGKMGYALAEAAAQRGAKVTVVTGPTSEPDPGGAHLVRVETTADMLAAVQEHLAVADVVIGSAAPSDYAPRNPAPRKIAKSESRMTLELERTPDVLGWVAEHKGERVVVGFSAETSDPVARAKGKLESKRLDLVVANDVTQPGAGFAVDTNIAALVFPDGRVEQLPLMSKIELAQRVMEVVARLVADRRAGQ